MLDNVRDIAVSIVIPCLNEEKTLSQVIRDARESFSGVTPFEIVVADNGSTDRSLEIAKDMGVRVVEVPNRGYGFALRGGFDYARGEFVLFGDGDNSYDFKEGPKLVSEIVRENVDMVIGTRLKGGLQRGAMPLLHRHVGTPVLTWLLNLLFRLRLSDCNSGFRVLRRKSLEKWRLSSTGMEFASELIIQCVKEGQQIREVPIHFRKTDRKSHLKPWRDGMRHLLFILSRAPHGFTYSGLTLFLFSLLMMVLATLFGPTRFGRYHLLDYHTMIICNLLGLFGSQCLVYGLLLDMRSKFPLAIHSGLLAIRETTLLKILLVVSLASLSVIVFLSGMWVVRGYRDLNYLRLSLMVLYFCSTLGSLTMGIFAAHIYKRL